MNTRSISAFLALAALAALGCSGGGDDTSPRDDGPEALGTSQSALTKCVTIQRTGSGQVADAQIASDKADTNYGASTVFNSGGVAGGARMTLLSFDTSSIPHGAILTSASMTLSVKQALSTATVRVHRVNVPWSEASVTWNTLAGAFDPATVASFTNGGAGFVGPVSADLQPLVQTWVNNAPANLGVLIEQTTQDNTNYWSSEWTSVTLRPKLTVCYLNPTCNDGVKNGNETGLDCGGPCKACDPCAGVVCTAPDACHNAGICIPGSGMCSVSEKPNGTTCSDGDSCTQGDACQSGVCAGTVIPSCTAPTGASLALQVFDTTGAPIPVASVTYQGSTLPTDGAGQLLFNNVAPGHFVARVEADGYAPASVVADVNAGANVGAEARLFPVGAPIPLDADAGGSLDKDGIHITIPPGSIVDQYGQPVTGPITATIVPLDPTTANLADLPGPLEGVLAGSGQTVNLESVVMAEVSLWGPSGERLGLAPGATATMELPIPSSLVAKYPTGTVIPAWWFDLDAGLWQEDGAGSVQLSSVNPGQLVWSVDVHHFTWWNADAPWTQKNCFDVFVVDSTSHPVGNIPVGAYGVSYIGTSHVVYTRPNGHACIEIMNGGTATIYAGLPSAPLVTVTVTASGPPSDCAGNGAPCAPLTITVPGPIICTPGAYQTCAYGGNPMLVGIGICQASTSVCNATGTAWGACAGQVLPAAIENCNTPFDDDCNGQTNNTGVNCLCTTGQTKPCYTGPAGTSGVGLCTPGTQACNLLHNGYGACTGQHLPAAETCSTPGDDDCNGTTDCFDIHLWSEAFGDASDQEGLEVALDGAGNAILAGDFGGTFSLGGAPLVSAGGADILVAKMDGATGAQIWAKSYGDANDQYGIGVAVDAAGDVFVTGYLTGSVDFGCGTLVAQGPDVFVAKLAGSNGACLWSKTFGDASYQIGLAVACDSGGNALVTGTFYSAIDFGGGAITSVGLSDLFVAKLAGSSGNQVWVKQFGDAAGYQEGWGIAVDGADNVIVNGRFWSAIDFGFGSLPSAGNSDVFLGKLSGATGAGIWGNRYGGAGFDRGTAVHADGALNVLATGSFEATVDFGGGPFPANGTDDAFVVKTTPAGAHLWSKHFGGAGYNVGGGIDVDGANNVLVSGGFSGVADFGGGTRTSAGNIDVFVAKFDSSGNHRWSKAYGDVSDDIAEAIAVNKATGTSIIIGEFGNNVSFGGTPFTGAGGTDLFLAKYKP